MKSPPSSMIEFQSPTIIGPIVKPKYTVHVDLRQSSFGVKQATVTLTGPFGDDYRQSVRTGPDASVTFDVPGSTFPEGYRYQVCVSGGLVSSLLPNCKLFTHNSGDESISMPVPG